MKLHMFVPLLALLLLFCGVRNICCATVPINSTDVLALLQFKQGITNSAEALSNWNTSTNICQWKGVTCNPKNRGRVTALNLSGQGLSGTIAASVGNLTLLHTLILSSNQLSGQIPPLNNLQKLQALDLKANSFEGDIPDTLTNCSSLRTLWLNKNFLVGTIPPNIGRLYNIQNLDLSSNNLTGIIPSSIQNMTDLRVLHLSTNQLSGSIPDELGKLSNMFALELAQNSLSGTIPAILFNMSFLEFLDLSMNKLGKTLPPNMGDRLLNLKELLLNGNEIEGQIPSSLGNASGIHIIQLSSNNLSGPIPTSLGKLLQLSILNLQLNSLEAWDGQSWEFLTALGNCSLLKLSLAYNNLQGVIPNVIGNLSQNLQTLYMGGNNLYGLVPPEIGKLHGLITLTLNSNNFTGSVGEWLGNLHNLQVLHLQENKFSGTIPSSIGNLKNLQSLYLAKNNLEGDIPSNFGNLQQLVELNLSYNKLQSSIPNELSTLGQLRICALSYNNLEGSIPLDLSKLQQVTELYLSSNKLDGEIPDSMGQCQALQIIEMDQNFLAGNIPASFSNIIGLNILNLSHNNLSGTIPTTLSNLQYLTSLDVSFNHLSGEVPRNGVFANSNAVSLQGNRGFCGGTVNFHLPSCRSMTTSKIRERQYYLIRVLIPIFGFLSLLLLAYFLITEKKMKRKYLTFPSYYDKQFPKVTYNDLAQATRNFSESNLIGRGSYGSVYRGKLKDSGMEMAIKVFDLEMPGAERSFLSECEALRSIQHRNLLPIITACSTVDNIGNVFKALLYEYMPNGSLDTWLHAKEEGKANKRLGLSQIINIIVNIADVLDYLHHDCGRTTVHCDLKPSNILLEDDMNALLGDFGIARFYAGSESTLVASTSSIGVRGTIGYIAPEYAGGGRGASTSGDVYSFGIVVLEMMTGRRPTDIIFKDGLDVVNFVNSNFPHQIFHVIDANLAEECKEFSQGKVESEDASYQGIVSLLQIALSCTRPLPSERMNMKEIASKVHAIQASYVGGKTKRYASPE